MDFDTYGDQVDPPLLLVLGWGNRPGHAPVEWLIDQLTETYYVQTATLPVHVTDVDSEWVRPLEGYADDLTEPAVVAHSAGGLTVARADIEAQPTVYLSPWWGSQSVEGPIQSALAKLPVDLQFLPISLDDPELLGVHTTETQIPESPTRVSPAFLSTIRNAHRTLPPIDRDAVVFCSLSDRIISMRAIGDRVASDRIVLFDGGHELFSCHSRETHLETLLAVLADGPEALEPKR